MIGKRGMWPARLNLRSVNFIRPTSCSLFNWRCGARKPREVDTVAGIH